MLELFNESNSKINKKEYPFEIKSFIVSIQGTNQMGTLFQTNNSMYPSLETH
jgi:hypothetical protein